MENWTTLSASQFVNGTTAQVADDHILHNNGVLRYDANGSAAGGVSIIAILTNRAIVLNSDIVLA